MIWILWAAFWVFAGWCLRDLYIYMNKLPYRWTCPKCLENGTTFKIAMNLYMPFRSIQLDHLEANHPK